MNRTLCTVFLASFSSLAYAQADSTDTGKLSISGYIDSYYLTAFNRPKSGNLLGVDQLAGRAFDRLADQFALGLVQTKFAYSNRKSDMVVDLTFGPNAEMGNFGNTTGAFNLYRPKSPYVAAMYGSSASIKQAYFTYRATPKLSFTVGQFGTHIGYEVIDAPLNYHYSLSHLFNNGPFYHLGLKTAYAFSDKTSVMLGVVNNWDNLTDDNKQKSFIGQFASKPLPGMSLYLNWIGGSSDDTYLNSLVDAGTLPAEFGNYAISDVVGVGVRYEYFEDQHKVRYLQAVNNALTVTAPILLTAGRLEASHAFGVYDRGYVTKKLRDQVRYQLTLGVKDGRYRLQFHDFVFACYQEDRTSRPVPTGKTKPLEDLAAPGWQKLWESHRLDTSATIGSLSAELKTAMLTRPSAPKLPAPGRANADW